ncbi:MAG: homocysteine S-methyltransferase family protein [Bacteroidota bacterium]
MKTLSQKLKEGKVLLSDGAWGTMLQDKGLKPGVCPELWNLTNADDVYDVAKSYIDAGSDMVETNSFGGSSFKLAMYDLQDKAFAINKAAAELSRRAAGENNHVLGSIGPTGKILMTGEVSFEDLYDSFKEQAMALEAGGADVLVIETMIDIEELKAALKACTENTSCEIICTMTFDKTGDDEYHTMMGVTPTQMVSEILNEKVSAIGTNCGNGIKDMRGIVDEIRKANSDIPIIVQANAGAPIYNDGETIFPETPEEMAKYVDILIDLGANIIGGCCGTTPDHIRKIAEVLKNRN